ncbi:MAG: hypothetical protein JWM41_262 [Gemmatimonadetes bacterium]|nr:hypothetical protein [Gemmatimonadota bacterium]
MIAGVDGCSAGWMVAKDYGDGQLRISVVPSVADLIADQDLELAVIDIPIGLLDRGVRAADREARQLLGHRASCVFNAPIRPVLAATDYSQANEIGRSVEGKGCSKQGFALVPKIVEVDKLVRSGGVASGRIMEGHPEVSFALMNGGTALSVSKHEADGRAARVRLLATNLGCDAAGLAGAWPSSLTSDVLDSLAMLWTARRVLSGSSSRIPKVPELDAFGIDAVITA